MIDTATGGGAASVPHLDNTVERALHIDGLFFVTVLVWLDAESVLALGLDPRTYLHLCEVSGTYSQLDHQHLLSTL